jgi:hypothetical protein
MWICVCSFFKVSCDIYVLVCVSLDLFWYCVVMMCGFFADSFCAMFVYLRFGVLFRWSRYWFGTALHLSTVSYRLLREDFARRVLGFRVVTFVVGNFNSCLIQNECLRGHASCNKRMNVGTP